MAFLLRLFRSACYAAFAILGVAALVVAAIETLALCPGFSANTGLSCGGAWYEGLANAALGIVLTSLVTVVPAVMAIAGLIFAVVALVRRCRTAA